MARTATKMPKRTESQIRALNAINPHMQKTEGRHQRAIRPPSSGEGSGVIGAPPIYDPIRFPHMANVLCKEYGFTAIQMGKIFGVSKKTVDAWMIKYPEFHDAVKAGKDQFDSVHVENALLKIALGYEYQERSVKSVSVRGVDSEGKAIRVPAKETTITTKMLPPNAKAIQFWLTNRQKDRWKMESTVRAEINSKTEHTENILNVSADLSKMDSTQLRALREIISTQKTEVIETTATEEIPMLALMERAHDIINAEEAEYAE